MKTLWDPRRRDEVLTRIRRLTPERPAQWGRMTCPQMVVHVTDAFDLYMGALSSAGKHTPLQYPPLKQVLLYLVPIPKNVPTAPELIARLPGEWTDEIARLEKAISTFSAQQTRRDWPPHPLFGRMSRRAYGVLAYRHTDHHLRQFGA